MEKSAYAFYAGVGGYLKTDMKYIEAEDYIEAIEIDGETFDFEDDNLVTIPSKVLADVKTNDLRDDTEINVCEQILDNVVHISSAPYCLKKIGDNKVRVSVDETGTRKYWDGEVGFKLYMETKKSIVQDRQKEVNDITLDDYDDEGNWISLQYHFDVDADNLGAAIQHAEQIIQEIEGATDLTLGSPFKRIENATNEADFTISIFIPLLRKLGFTNVKYNHGKREFGKDVVFARKTEFDDLEYWGAQAKFGDISGGATSDINTIINQAEDAFRMPFYDVYSRTKQRISKLVIVTSGKFTNNAVEKICEGIERHSLKNNMIFIDGDKIDTLTEKFTK